MPCLIASGTVVSQFARLSGVSCPVCGEIADAISSPAVLHNGRYCCHAFYIAASYPLPRCKELFGRMMPSKLIRLRRYRRGQGSLHLTAGPGSFLLSNVLRRGDVQIDMSKPRCFTFRTLLRPPMMEGFMKDDSYLVVSHILALLVKVRE